MYGCMRPVRPCASCTVATPSSPRAVTTALVRTLDVPHGNVLHSNLPNRLKKCSSAYTSGRFSGSQKPEPNVVDASPLSGIKVVDMTEALAGPYCAMLLGDLGADVVKVERPKAGDQARGWGPPFLEGESAYFLSVNRNKRSVELDIKVADDLARLAEADRPSRRVSHEQSASRVAATRGASPGHFACPSIRALIYAAISGYGHTGPKADRSGYDIIAQGEAGLMALTGPVDGGPSRFPTPMADISGRHLCDSRRPRGALRSGPQRRHRSRANLSTSRWSTRRPPGSPTSVRRTLPRASALGGSATRIRT